MYRIVEECIVAGLLLIEIIFCPYDYSHYLQPSTTVQNPLRPPKILHHHPIPSTTVQHSLRPFDIVNRPYANMTAAN